MNLKQKIIIKTSTALEAFKNEYFVNDRKYIENKYYKRFGRKPNLSDPKTFNEKLQWLKLYWRDEKAGKCADKYAVRDYVRDKKLDFLLNEIYGVYDSVEDIELEKLPDKFVLKTTHGSGWNIICTNKKEVNWDEKLFKMEKWLHRNFFYCSREWVYRKIKRQIICEKYLEDGNRTAPVDYKILCFNGEPKCLSVDLDKFTASGIKIDYYDIEWNKLPFKKAYPNSTETFEKPKQFEEMVSIARILSADFPFVRVDLYLVEEKIYFGELTFFPGSGLGPFYPEKYDYWLGDYLILPTY